MTLSIDFENILLYNDLIIIRNHGDDEEDIGEGFGGMEDQQGYLSQVGIQFRVCFRVQQQATQKRTPRSHMGISLDVAKKIYFPIELVPCQKSFEVDGNNQYKWMFRICFSAEILYFGLWVVYRV
jgi:hypothetical protein